MQQLELDFGAGFEDETESTEQHLTNHVIDLRFEVNHPETEYEDVPLSAMIAGARRTLDKIEEQQMGEDATVDFHHLWTNP